MTATTTAPAGVPFIYEGASIHARGFALGAVYDSLGRPPADDVWMEYGYVPNCWRHADFPGHILWKPAHDIVLIAQLRSATPTASTVLQLGQLALGRAAAPLYVTSYPLALRMAMRGPGTLVLPPDAFRCRRLWPHRGEPAHVVMVEGIPVELRISGTRGKRGVRLYAEAFIGRAHETKKNEPRSLIFSGDARHVLIQRNPDQLKRFTARVMDVLLLFAYERRDLGVEVDHRRLTGRQVARVQLRMGDLAFAIRLPQSGRTLRYVGDYFKP